MVQRAPGKRTLTQSLVPVQRRAREAPPAPPTPANPSGGSAMPALVQAKMEDAFDFDFSAVRVHEGGGADAIGARAYTQGTDIHFAPGEYAPHDAAGQALLGHELAHVVQQGSGRVAPTMQAKGLAFNDDDGLEREADDAGAAAARGERVSIAGSGGRSSGAVQAKSADAPIQRVAKHTHYGTFTDEKYELGVDDITMVLKFTPNDKVDATKIGLTQSLRSYRNGANFQIDPTTAGRTSPSGHFIDALSEENNPLYAQSVNVGEGLKDTPMDDNASGDPTELNPDRGDNAIYELGYRHNPGTGWEVKDAGLLDTPTTAEVTANAGKEFETAALAVDGTQAGMYYGSVKWGWKADGAATLSLIDFDVVSTGAPSKDFLGAAAAWNSGTTRGSLSPKANGTHVYADDGTTSQFTLDTTDAVKQNFPTIINDIIYVEVTVASAGPHKDKTGYMKVSELDDSGDGVALVALPVVDVKKLNAQTNAYDDANQTTQLHTLAQDTRVKVTATSGLMSKIEVVDGADITKTGWVVTTAVVAE